MRIKLNQRINEVIIIYNLSIPDRIENVVDEKVILGEGHYRPENKHAITPTLTQKVKKKLKE